MMSQMMAGEQVKASEQRPAGREWSRLAAVVERVLTVGERCWRIFCC